MCVQRILSERAAPANLRAPMETAYLSQWSVTATMTAATTVTRLLSYTVVGDSTFNNKHDDNELRSENQPITTSGP